MAQFSFIFLIIAIIFGVMGTFSMKLSNGLSNLRPTLCLIIFYAISFSAMTLSLRYLDLSIVYGVWSGVGTVLVSLISIAYFHESLSIKKFIFLLLIIIGVIGIHLGDHLVII